MQSVRAILLASLALAACAPAPMSKATMVSSGSPKASPTVVPTGTAATNGKTGELRGRVVAPKGYHAPDKALPGGPRPAVYHLTDLEEVAVVGAEVFLGSRRGEPYKGPSIGKTTVNGEFKITKVPLDLTFLVLTDTLDPEERHKELCGVARTLQAGNDIVISLGSTMVTLGMLKNMTGNILGQLDLTLYTKCVAAATAQLDPKNLPDPSNPASIDAFLATVKIDGQAISLAISALQQGLAVGGVSADETQALLGQFGTGFINISGQGSVSANGQTVAAGSGQATVTNPGSISIPGFDPSTIGLQIPPLPPLPTATPQPTPSPTTPI